MSYCHFSAASADGAEPPRESAFSGRQCHICESMTKRDEQAAAEKNNGSVE